MKILKSKQQLKVKAARCIITLLAMSVLLQGCFSDMQQFSSGQIGCPPNEIEISQVGCIQCTKEQIHGSHTSTIGFSLNIKQYIKEIDIPDPLDVTPLNRWHYSVSEDTPGKNQG